VDHRRNNRSEESVRVNKERLEAYKAKLVVFPSPEAEPVAQHTGEAVLPIVKAAATAPEYRAITDEERKASVYTQLRQARSYARLIGYRQKRAQEQSEKKKAPGRR
jgi:large subunit ribosomal protein L13e